MSKEINNIYKKMNAHLSKKHSTTSTPNTGLVAKRELKGDDEMTIVGYVKKIRDVRGEFNASK